MNDTSNLVGKAISELFEKRTFRFDDRETVIACLIRENDWRPLKAPWWRQKEAYIIGVDLDGNFFLRHCDGSVRYWDHKTQNDSVAAKSVRDFLSKIF